MSIANITWNISPQYYVNMPDKWAHKEFKAWAGHAITKGYINQSQLSFLIPIFDTASRSLNPSLSLHNDLFPYEIGNVLTHYAVAKIEKKAAQIFAFKNVLPITFPVPAPVFAPIMLPLPVLQRTPRPIVIRPVHVHPHLPPHRMHPVRPIHIAPRATPLPPHAFIAQQHAHQHGRHIQVGHRFG
jgi:hypothetical protein